MGLKKEIKKQKKFRNLYFQIGFSCLVGFSLMFISLIFSYYSESKKNPSISFSEQGDIKVLGEESEINSSGKNFISENYQIKQISLGESLIVSEDVPQENFLKIFDIKGEAYISEQNKKNFKILVTWRTNQPSRFEIEYYPIANKKNKKKVSDSAYNMNHAAVIDQLNSGESYVYKINCSDRWGKQVLSDSHSVLSSSEPVLITDLINKSFKDTFGWAMKKD